VNIRAAWIGLCLSAACHQHLPLTEPATTPAPPSTSTACNGGAPLDAAMARVPRIRASWFPDPESGARLYVLEAGPRYSSRPPLVLFHGVGPGGLSDFADILSALSEHRKVLGVDLPGFGQSERKGDDFGPERMVRAVDAVVRACAPGKVDVLGHSSGGALALLFAAERAAVVRRLIVVDAAGILLPETLLHSQLHGQLKDLRKDAKAAGKLVALLGDAVISVFGAMLSSAESLSDSGLLGRSPSVLTATALVDFNFGPAMAKIRAPTLIMWGEKDVVMPARIGHLLDDRIEHSELVFVPNAGHLPMDDAPAEFISLIDRFLNARSVRREPAQARNRATREGSCRGQEAVTLTGDYADITIDQCKQVWLNRVRARHVAIRNSQVRLDHAEITNGLVADDSVLTITGGELRGQFALDLNHSEVDLAGTVLQGVEGPVRARAKSELSLSVTTLMGPSGTRILHEELTLEDAQQL